MKTTNLFAILLAALVALSSAQATITINTVPVGNVGNANDPATDNLYGGVGYAYNIGKYEVTVGQYAAFLNAVAATDTYALYNTNMESDLNIAGIARSGASGSFSYSVIGSANHPVTYVSWGDAARFSNWLNNDQPTGAQNAGTTEDGAYTLNGAISNLALNAVSRNTGARWVIPSESEWYKAAYYQPAAQGGDSDNYWNYPMRTNSVPYSDQPPGATSPDNTRVGNFYGDDQIANNYYDGYAVSGSDLYSTSQNYLTDVGAYASSPTFYGTFDQGGNVFEWNEALLGGSFRGARAGSWDVNFGYLAASLRHSAPPANEYFSAGFRVASIDIGDYNDSGGVDAADYVSWRKNPGGFPADAYATWRSHFGSPAGSSAIVGSNTSVPEPSSLLLAVMGSVGMLLRRRALR